MLAIEEENTEFTLSCEKSPIVVASPTPATIGIIDMQLDGFLNATVSLKISTDVARICIADSIQDDTSDIDYSIIAKALRAEWAKVTKLEQAYTSLKDNLMPNQWAIQLQIKTHYGYIRYESEQLATCVIDCNDVIIGMRDRERSTPQSVVLHLENTSPLSDEHVSVLRQLVKDARKSTIEALADAVCQKTALLGIRCDAVQVDKPAALRDARRVSIRMLQKYPTISLAQDEVLIGIGSSIGDRLANVHRAIKELGLPLLSSSFLYETSNPYLGGQSKFLNCVIKVQTAEHPTELFWRCKKVEATLGRDLRAPRWAARIIDLDILFYGNIRLSTDELAIPHPRAFERDFVLHPLADIFAGPLQNDSLRYHLPHVKSDRTMVMGILNYTPDSFSDGGLYNNEHFIEHVSEMIKAGADIIDVGGQSTRPGAPLVSLAEELERVVPVITQIRACFPQVTISVDTFRPSVARAAIEAGAGIVNDVSGGRFSDNPQDTNDEIGETGMFRTVARLQVPYCLMHSRGTPQTMSSMNQYSEDLVGNIRAELEARIERAVACGVLRWNIVVDPGIGFAKSQGQCCAVLKSLFTGCRYPLLVGPSRKLFIGQILNRPDPSKRVWGTAAAVTAAIAAGADIVRVHDVQEMADVVRVADAIYRQ